MSMTMWLFRTWKS